MTDHELDGKRVIVRRAYEWSSDAWHVVGTAFADGDCSTQGCKVFEDGNYNHYTVDAEDDKDYPKVVGRTFHERELLTYPQATTVPT